MSKQDRSKRSRFRRQRIREAEAELLETCLRDLIESLELVDHVDDPDLTEGTVARLENTHSLRDADNYSHAVFMHIPGSTERVLGHGNTQVKEAYMRRIRAWHAMLPQPTTLKRGTAGALLAALDAERAGRQRDAA